MISDTSPYLEGRDCLAAAAVLVGLLLSTGCQASGTLQAWGETGFFQRTLW